VPSSFSFRSITWSCNAHVGSVPLGARVSVKSWIVAKREVTRFFRSFRVGGENEAPQAPRSLQLWLTSSFVAGLGCGHRR
jgi:hypothetical protein